jgi:hypothetical protein
MQMRIIIKCHRPLLSRFYPFYPAFILRPLLSYCFRLANFQKNSNENYSQVSPTPFIHFIMGGLLNISQTLTQIIHLS